MMKNVKNCPNMFKYISKFVIIMSKYVETKAKNVQICPNMFENDENGEKCQKKMAKNVNTRFERE